MSDLERHLEDGGESGLFTRLTRVGLLLDIFQHDCLDEFGLRFVDFSVMRVLVIVGEQTPSALADLTLRSTGGMTQIVDRLEKAGLVLRSPDAADRRKVVVGLTPKGRRLTEAAQRAYQRERSRVLGSLTSSELAEVDGAVRRLLALLSDEVLADELAS